VEISGERGAGWSGSIDKLLRMLSTCARETNLDGLLRIQGCRVVSAADPLEPYSRFSRPEPLLFLPSSSSVVLMRLSGPLSRPTTSQKIW
jgi:hypothetical protein